MPKLRLNVRAVILDMDGVITNTMPVHYRCWKIVLKRIGIPVSRYDVYCREGQPGIRTVCELAQQYGKRLEEGRAQQILRDKEACFKKNVRARFIAGSRTFVKRLAREQFRLALVTGTSHHEMCRILPPHLRQLFSVIITGSDVRHGKPHPEPYLKSMEKLGLPATEAVAIENAPFGIQSAKAAGLGCLAVATSLPRRYLVDADVVSGSIKELTQKVCFTLQR